jgi:hypothetical protein
VGVERELFPLQHIADRMAHAHVPPALARRAGEGEERLCFFNTFENLKDNGQIYTYTI